MEKDKLNLRQLFDKLAKNMGPQNWWPAQSIEEMLISMILIQNTNSQSVAKSIENLRSATDSQMNRVLEMPESQLQELIKPSGFYKNKSQYIKTILEMYKNDYLNLQKLPTAQLRTQLLKLRGIGNETADVILLYLFHRKTFVADTYALRLFYGLTGEKYTYAKLRNLAMADFNFSQKEAEEFHALIDELGKDKEYSQQFYSQNQLIW